MRHTRPRLELLENREVPAGVIQAAISAGVLTLTGDDDNNDVTIWVSAADVTVTPDATTVVNGRPAGEVVIIPGAANSLRASLKGGNDSLAIDAVADFVLPGGAKVDLGDGDNTLNWTTDGKIELASLSVLGGDGTDTVTVDAGTGLGKIAGPATFDGRLGMHFVTLQDLQFPGPAGVVVKGVGGRLGGNLTLSTVTAAGPLLIGMGNTNIECTITDSTVGRITAPANRGIMNATLTRATVMGNIVLKGPGSAAIIPSESELRGNVLVAGFGATVLADNVSVLGNVTVKAATIAQFEAHHQFSAGNVSVSGLTGTSSFTATGGTTEITVNGNLTVVGPGGMAVDFSTGPLSQVNGNLTAVGGPFGGSFNAGNHLRVGGNLTLNMPGGENSVSIGGVDIPLEVGKNLTIKSGTGNDAIALNFITVLGATLVTTGSGADILAIDQGANFTGTFSANLGSGDDLVAFAQSAGATQPVEFTGKVTVLCGTGNDTLQLGNIAGDANSLVRFEAAGNKIDGGLALNWFDDETQQFGVSPIGTLTLLGWTDPTP
jgi:large repetitive protein